MNGRLDDPGRVADPGRLADKVAVITGAASGIGAGTARHFVAQGARVVVADLQADAGSALVEELGDVARFARVDVAVEDDVAAAVDRLDPAAEALGSVNTVSWHDDELVGSSTDGAGFVSSLADDGVDITGADVAVIGAGGAARSVIDELGRSGAASVSIINRTAERAESACRLTAVASVGSADDIAGAHIVINASSVGMGVDPAGAAADQLPCDPALLHAEQVVVDLVYHPLQTAWLRCAEQAGARAIDGLGMLIHQAALQQQAWLGERPDVDVMRRAALAALAAR